MGTHLLLVLSLFVALSSSYKILVLGPFQDGSHSMFMSSFVKALLDRGHQVTYLTCNSLNSQSFDKSNYTEVLIDPPFNMSSIGSPAQNVYVFTRIMNSFRFRHVTHAYYFENPNVQKLIHSTNLHFDVILNEEFYQESFLMFAYKFNAPIISICSFGITNDMDQQMGLLTPMSIAPNFRLPYTDDMSFLQRFHNAAVTLFDMVATRFIHLPAQESLAKMHFAHLEPLPALSDLKKNISLMLTNNHRAFAPPRPAMPGMRIISIGGAHLKPAKPLPVDLQRFLDDAKDGVIYFSLGSVLQSSKLPKETIHAFLDSFKHIKQRVMWKFEDDSLIDIPSNVMIRKWMPQNDVLAHPNVVLFISHAGLFGTLESIHHGVPMLLIPFFADQFRNANRIVTAGYGKLVPFSEISTEVLKNRIEELTSDDKYSRRARETSAIFRDNLVHPMDEAMFWIEHVAKFKGAKHLKSHAVNMSWFSYLSLDILLLNALIVSPLPIAIYFILKKLLSKPKVGANKKNK